MAHTDKIFLLESHTDIKLSDANKNISFGLDGNIFACEYISRLELDRIYGEVFQGVSRWFSSLPAKVFFFEGIDIIKPFKGDIFYHILTLCQKKKALENIVKKEDPVEIWVQRIRPPGTRRYSYFDEFIEDVDLGIKCVHYLDECREVPSENERMSPVTGPMSGLANLARKLYNLTVRSNQKKILIFSDLHKIPLLMDLLPRNEVVFLREALPYRHTMYLAGRGAEIALFGDMVIGKDVERSLSNAKEDLLEKMGSIDVSLMVEGIDIGSYIKKFVLNIWEKLLYKALKRVLQAKALFENERFRCLLADEDKSVVNNILIQTAKLYGCPSFVNMHGYPDHRIGYVPLDAEKILVWGKRHESVLSEWGVDKKNIFVTGCTKYDVLPARDSGSLKRRVCIDMRLDKERKLIVTAPRMLIKERDILAKEIFDRTSSMIDVIVSCREHNVVVKLHQGDPNAARWRALYEGAHQGKLKIIEKYDPLVLAQAADLIVVEGSMTFAMDGLACGKPVILCDDKSFKRLEGLGYFYDGTTSTKLQQVIQGILKGERRDHEVNREKALKECLEGNDGNASRRLADILMGHKKELIT
jgi:hypothetical protein